MGQAHLPERTGVASGVLPAAYLPAILATALSPDRKLLALDSAPSPISRLHEIALDPEKIVTFDTTHRDTIFSLSLSDSGETNTAAAATASATNDRAA